MQLEGTHTFHAPLSAVWDALMDPATLTKALPGGEQLVKLSDTDYLATMNVRVGPVQGKFEGKIQLTDILPLQSYRLKVSGQGAPGFVNGEGVLQLEESGAGALLRYSGDVQIGGKIAGVSQRLVESTAKSLTRQGLEALERQIQVRLAPTPIVAAPPAAEGMTSAPLPAAAPQPAAAGPSPAGIAANVMADVARDLASDYIPPAQQEKVFWAVVGALGMLLFVVLVRLVQKRP